MERREDPGGADPSGKCRAWAEPAVRREYPCMVRADMEFGTVPADSGKAVEAGTECGTVSVIHIVADGTVDERIMKALEMKDGTQAALIEAVKAEIGMDAE